MLKNLLLKVFSVFRTDAKSKDTYDYEYLVMINARWTRTVDEVIQSLDDELQDVPVKEWLYLRTLLSALKCGEEWAYHSRWSGRGMSLRDVVEIYTHDPKDTTSPSAEGLAESLTLDYLTQYYPVVIPDISLRTPDVNLLRAQCVTYTDDPLALGACVRRVSKVLLDFLNEHPDLSDNERISLERYYVLLHLLYIRAQIATVAKSTGAYLYHALNTMQYLILLTLTGVPND